MRSTISAQAPAYPALVACIGEARRPSHAELMRVIRRLRREIFPVGRMDAVLRRRLSRAALAALGGVA